MFQIFRRHQKTLLTTVAVIAIGSMAFSAIAPIFMDQNPASAAQKDLAKSLDVALMRLYDHSFDACEDKLIFPEAMFSETLIHTGVLEAAALKVKDVAQIEINQTFETIANYKFLEVMPGMSYLEIISKISPSLAATMQKMQHAKDASYEDKLSLLTMFFKQKQNTPAILFFQYIQALSKGQAQVTLEDLEWFGLKNPQDFFGKTIIKQSIVDVTQGLSGSLKQQDGFTIIQKYQSKLSSFYGTNVHPNQYFVAIGVDPKAGLEALKMLEAIYSLKKNISDGLLLDAASHSAFYDFATKKIDVKAYSFSKDLIPSSLEDVAMLDLYMKEKDALNFDEYEIKIKSLDKVKAFSRIPKKQLYSQALNGYSELSLLMPYALSQNLSTDKERLEAIKNLSGSSKALFENHMQQVILKDNPQFYQKALEEVSSKTQTVFLSKSSKVCPIEGFASVDQLRTELDMMPVNTPVIFDLGSSFMHEIELVSKKQGSKVTNYQQACDSGMLKEKLKQSLEVSFKDMVKKNPHKFVNAEKKLKSLDEVYFDVLEIHLKDQKKKMAQCLNVSEDMPSKLLIKGYPKLVLADAKHYKDKLDDFRIQQQTQHLSRHEVNDPSCIALFDSTDAVVSDVILQNDGSFVFYEKIGKVMQGEPVLKKEAFEALASEKLKQELQKRIK